MLSDLFTSVFTLLRMILGTELTLEIFIKRINKREAKYNIELG